MAWSVSGNNLTMAEGDFGVALTTKLKGFTLGPNDSLSFVIKKRMNGDEILNKAFNNIEENTFQLILSSEESAKLGIGTYVYRLDWFQNGVFMDNIIPSASFKVVDKA